MKEISQEMFIKSVGMNGIDGEKIITMIYSKHININNKELEKLFSVIREFFDSLLFYGFTVEESNEIFYVIMNKYGDLETKEMMQVLYAAMTSCNDDPNLSIENRMMYIDGLWYASKKYAKFRSKLKDLDSDDICKVITNALYQEQGYFLTEEELEYMSLGIINISIIIDEIEKNKKNNLGNQKKL
ncbi:MAG: hypothetical protein IKJ43_03835 [Bacilli bacterium]|nr:hypothetical protein [Bacilli bacterium]